MSRIALVVGINKYPDPEDELDYCRADAESVAACLEQPEYGFDVSLLLDKNATRYKILEVLGTVGELEPDFFFFYFSGHGVVTDFGSYLVTADAQLFDEGIPLDQLNIEGVSFERARVILLNRVEEALRGVPLVNRKHMQHNIFQIQVTLRQVSTNVEGLEHVRSVLRRVLNALER